MNVSSYGKVWNYFDASIKPMFEGFVEIEEKIDGSQFSAIVDEDGVMHFRSKGVQVFPDNAGMFTLAVKGAQSMSLKPMHTYRFEYLSKPKHNTLAYARVPKNNLILFEVEGPEYNIFNHEQLVCAADDAGCEHVPLLGRADVASSLDIQDLVKRETEDLLNTESVLGSEKIEGFVIKCRDRRHTDGKVLKAKVVSDLFKERHQKNWKKANPTSSDIVSAIGESLNTEARFEKVFQSLRDRGELELGLRDIGKLMAEYGKDLLEEEEEYIKDRLFKWAWSKVQRKASHGLPQWYKSKLATSEIGV